MIRLLYPKPRADFRWYNILPTPPLQVTNNNMTVLGYNRMMILFAYGFCKLSGDNGLIVALYATEEESLL